MGILDGKVVLVTGAANGIGKECALLAAKEGARVIVNDIGGTLAGAGASASAAELVVREIKGAGGEAAANAESVASREGVKRMIEQALDLFKGLHAVINPAGILRDGMFHKMEDKDWDAVLDVHLNGSYNVARAAINRFREQQDGAFVFFTSTSGLIGNIGQANYAAAKMGICGLSRIIAMEGAAKNVRANCIAPFAWTRMISSIPVKDEESARRVEMFKTKTRADQVANLAVALASPATKDVSGQIFVARGNEYFVMSQPRPVRGIARADGWTPQSICDRLIPALKAGMTGLENSASVFSWDPI